MQDETTPQDDAAMSPASDGSVDALLVLRKLVDGVRGMTYGDPDDPASVEASTIVRWAVDEIEQLRESIEWHKEVLVEAEELMLRKNLTDAERTAIRWAESQAKLFPEFEAIRGHTEALHGLLERLK